MLFCLSCPRKTKPIVLFSFPNWKFVRPKTISCKKYWHSLKYLLSYGCFHSEPRKSCRDGNLRILMVSFFPESKCFVSLLLFVSFVEPKKRKKEKFGRVAFRRQLLQLLNKTSFACSGLVALSLFLSLSLTHTHAHVHSLSCSSVLSFLTSIAQPHTTNAVD